MKKKMFVESPSLWYKPVRQVIPVNLGLGAITSLTMGVEPIHSYVPIYYIDNK